MEENLKSLLKISTDLYQYLADGSEVDDRDKYIEEINRKLDERGEIIEALRHDGFILNNSNKLHLTLAELDKGIRVRLNKIFIEVKSNLKDLQNQKKNEVQYMNPYADVRTMDGMYYDKKK